MSRPAIIKQLNEGGITTASDGLLHDWLSKGLLGASLGEIERALEKRRREITFLKYLRQQVKRTLEEQKNETVS